MPNQENGNIKRTYVRLNMVTYRKLEKFAESRGIPTSTAMRAIVEKAVHNIPVNGKKDRERITRMVEANWVRIRNKDEKKRLKK